MTKLTSGNLNIKCTVEETHCIFVKNTPEKAQIRTEQPLIWGITFIDFPRRQLCGTRNETECPVTTETKGS